MVSGQVGRSKFTDTEGHVDAGLKLDQVDTVLPWDLRMMASMVPHAFASVCMEAPAESESDLRESALRVFRHTVGQHEYVAAIGC